MSVDRTKAAGVGFTPRDVANSVLLTLSGSGQTNPVQFLNWQNGVSYNLITQTPQYSIQSIQDLQNVPISSSTSTRPQILGDVASISRASGKAVISHYNTRRVVDIYGSVQDRDLGAVGRDISRIVEAHRPNLPRGSFVTLRGQVETMRTAYVGLLGGLAFAIVLVHLLIVVNFQSWLDPFIIITALPAALAGIIVFFFLTNTDMEAMLSAVVAGTCVSGEASREMRRVLEAQHIQNRPARRLGEGVRVANKTENFPDAIHDAGFVTYSGGTLVVAVLSARVLPSAGDGRYRRHLCAARRLVEAAQIRRKSKSRSKTPESPIRPESFWLSLQPAARGL